MSFQTKVSNLVLNLVDVLLRVPPLFIIDELFRIGLGIPAGQSPLAERNDTQVNLGSIDSDGGLLSVFFTQNDFLFYKVLLILIGKIIVAICCKYMCLISLLFRRYISTILLRC